MRLGRSLVLGLALSVGAVASAPRAARAQQVSARFPIDTVLTDTTFRFTMGALRWVPQRGRGIVVDPTRRDALVARFRILSVSEGVVTGLVTGQTSELTTQHFVQMVPPAPPRWYKRGSFWGGAALGGVAGLFLGGALF